jgi:hypothetical protein
MPMSRGLLLSSDNDTKNAITALFRNHPLFSTFLKYSGYVTLWSGAAKIADITCRSAVFT